MDPRLRAAVDASRHWYDDVFALHGIPVRVEDGLWSALAAPPPWHSAAKTLEPAVGTERVVRAVAGLEHCAVADSFGEIEPERHGFQLLIDARWVHRDPCRGAPDQMPGGWSVIETVDDLAEWAAAHDYTDVLPAGVLQHPAFRILALRHDGSLVGGAVTHDGGGGALGLSNTWGEGSPTASGEVLAAVAALHPDRAVTDFAQGAELDALLAAGFTAVGPQRVWVRWRSSADVGGLLGPGVADYRGGMGYQVEKTDEQWREELSPEEYAVLREAGTERPFVGEYTDTETKGVYSCKACGAKLFESDTKFHSGCGWPSFYQPITDTVEYLEDTSHGMKRVEVRCASCGSHLGHVFPDGYGTPTGDRYCINSISLTLAPADS